MNCEEQEYKHGTMINFMTHYKNRRQFTVHKKRMGLNNSEKF